MAAIRLIGQHHTTHHEGSVLTIGDEATARVNPHVVTMAHAYNLIATGEAEWIGEPPAQAGAEHEHEDGDHDNGDRESEDEPSVA